MKRPPLPHFVVTRLGIGVSNEEWFHSALGLFEAITFPSLCAQSSMDFTALLIIDREMPSNARSRLAAIVGNHPNFHIVPIDLLGMRSVRQGCFDYVWDRCQDYLLAGCLIKDPFAYVVTSVLDGDDALHRDTVALVQERAVAELPKFHAAERKDAHWQRHTGGMCLTFPDGLQWFAHSDVVQPRHQSFASMSVFVAARFSSGISACSSRHLAWPSYCDVLGFKGISANAGRPMWVYCRHDRAEVPWDARDLSSDPRCVDSLHSEFGIDFDKVTTWRTNHRPRGAREDGAVPLQHDGIWAMEQLDCYFRITALNRQIATLERQAKCKALDPAGRALLDKQRALRDDLRAVYDEQAHSLYR